MCSVTSWSFAFLEEWWAREVSGESLVVKCFAIFHFKIDVIVMHKGRLTWIHY